MHRVPDRFWLAAGARRGRRPARGGRRPGRAGGRPGEGGAAAWRGFVDGERSAVAVGQRMIVVLRYPSLADRMAEAGGHATESDMRQLDGRGARRPEADRGAALAGGDPARPGLRLHAHVQRLRRADRRRALALLERDDDVVGVYPVRAAYPASLSADALPSRASRRGAGRGPELAGIPGFDGCGMTIALLDTGVDITHPYIRDRLPDGIDVLDPDGARASRGRIPTTRRASSGTARSSRDCSSAVAGRAASGASRPGATILPIRVAGWQPSAEGGFAVYGRTDQLLAGLERAVDPDADGRSLDAARVAVVGVTEPFAAFGDGPVALAVAGAAELDTLVVVPAGNEGPAGPGYGSIGGPGGAPAALTVGAADLRRETAKVRVVVRAGLGVLLDREVPLAGAAAPRGTLTLGVARPRRDAATGPRGAARPLLRQPRLQRRRGPRRAARARDGLPDEARDAVAGRSGGDPRRRARPGWSARSRRPSRRSGRRGAAVGRGFCSLGARPGP